MRLRMPSELLLRSHPAFIHAPFYCACALWTIRQTWCACAGKMAALVHRCEALVDGRKVNEAVDLLNQLGKPYQYHTILCTILFTHAREESEFYLVHTVYNTPNTHTHTHTLSGQAAGGGGGERGGSESQRTGHSTSRKNPCQTWLC